MKLDRTAFHAGTHEEATKEQAAFWKKKTMGERLQAVCYLIAVSFNYPQDNQPCLERTLFSFRKHAD